MGTRQHVIEGLGAFHSTHVPLSHIQAGLDISEANIGNPLAIVLDSNIYSAPRINSRITTRGQITGRFSSQEAADLAVKAAKPAKDTAELYVYSPDVDPTGPDFETPLQPAIAPATLGRP